MQDFLWHVSWSEVRGQLVTYGGFLHLKAPSKHNFVSTVNFVKECNFILNYNVFLDLTSE